VAGRTKQGKRAVKSAEQVTFGGSGLDRAAELRSEAEAHWSGAEVVAFWRGKPLLVLDPETNSPTRLVRLSSDARLLDHAGEARIFLGREDNRAVFAVDVSAWEPDEVPDTMGAFFDPSYQSPPGHPATEAFGELRGAMTFLSPRDAELAATARALLEWHRTHQYCANCGAKSHPSQGGWQRDCPSCGRHHFPRTDPVVIMLITRGNDCLLGRSPGWPEGMYSCLAGFIEPGETIEAAVRREVFEEAGVHVGAVRYLASQPWPFPASLMMGCQGEATSDEITIDPVEIEEAIWVSKEELMQAFAGAHPTIKPARKGAIAHFLLRNWLADTLD